MKRSRLASSRKPLVKLVQIDTQLTNLTKNQLPLIFIHHEEVIFIPDFNIHTLLQIINSNIHMDIIEDYVILKYSLQ